MTSLCQAQIEFYRPSPFVVWMHRFDDYENTCILVRPDASYHLERSQNHRQVVYAGLLSADEFTGLKSLLDDSDFEQITRTEVINKLVVTDPDPFQIRVPRKGFYQELTFVDADSRRPFRKSVDPLIAWFSKMKKDKRSIPSMEAVNGCMPEPAAESPKIAALQPSRSEKAGDFPPGEQPSTERPPGVQGFEFLVRFVVDGFSNGTAKRVCVAVFADGSYRMERSSQRVLEGKDVDVFKGELTQPQTAELKRLLGLPDLVNVVHRNTPSGVAVSEGEIVSVQIPRDKYVQNLIYTDYFGASDRWSDRNVQPGSSSIDAEFHVVKPVREWIRANIEKQKGKAEKEERPNGCSSMEEEP
ncbi:MAG: hypothetical protein ACM3JB_11640 [Acidobacteriaceae bacterium]